MYKVIRKRLHICKIFVNIEFLKILKTYALLVSLKILAAEQWDQNGQE